MVWNGSRFGGAASLIPALRCDRTLRVVASDREAARSAGDMLMGQTGGIPLASVHHAEAAWAVALQIFTLARSLRGVVSGP
jgi:hypothetical protein